MSNQYKYRDLPAIIDMLSGLMNLVGLVQSVKVQFKILQTSAFQLHLGSSIPEMISMMMDELSE